MRKQITKLYLDIPPLYPKQNPPSTCIISLPPSLPLFQNVVSKPSWLLPLSSIQLFDTHKYNVVTCWSGFAALTIGGVWIEIYKIGPCRMDGFMLMNINMATCINLGDVFLSRILNHILCKSIFLLRKDGYVNFLYVFNKSCLKSADNFRMSFCSSLNRTWYFQVGQNVGANCNSY